MIPQNQLTNTDCLRACLASLLELNTHEVPDFVKNEDTIAEESATHDGSFPRWWSDTQDWLKERGLCLVEIKLVENLPWFPLPHSAFCICIGDSPRGVRHMVIGTAQGGFVGIHDPHPDKCGIQNVDSVAFLVPLDPATYYRMGVRLEMIEKTTWELRHQLVMGTLNTMAREALNLPPAGIILPINGSR